MKTILRPAAAIMLSLTLMLLVGCKDNNATTGEGEATGQTTSESTGINADGTETQTETSETLNDTNVSGTTSGEMEQVP